MDSLMQFYRDREIVMIDAVRAKSGRGWLMFAGHRGNVLSVISVPRVTSGRVALFIRELARRHAIHTFAIDDSAMSSRKALDLAGEGITILRCGHMNTERMASRLFHSQA